MIKIELSDTDLLKNTIPILSEIIDEGVFKVDNNGISLLSPDRTMVAVVDFKILSSAFASYHVDKEASLGLNLASLVSILKRVKSNEKLTMETEDGGNRLKLTIKGQGKRVFEIPLIDVSTEKPPIDQLKFDNSLMIDSSIVEEGIEDAEIAGDSVVFMADSDFFKMHSKGDVSSTELELRKGDKVLHHLKVEGAIKSRYPLEYLKKMIKAAKVFNQMEIRFGTDYPMKLDFKSVDKMHLSFVLAPRVEE
jgi:proliferating cell nuclear antigen